MNNVSKSHLILIIGSLLSGILLLVFSLMQYYDSIVLELDIQWILLAIAPIFISMISGGYISRFKGFGIELDSKLNAPITSINFKVTDAIKFISNSEKGTISILYHMSNSEKQNIEQLSFILGKKDYYDTSAILDYLKSLNSLKFFEIKRFDGTFVCLIPVSIFKSENVYSNNNTVFDRDRLEKFKRALEQETLLEEFTNSCITTTVRQNNSLIEALDILRKDNSEYAIVISRKKKFLGLVTSHDIERKIADDVLYTKNF